jgi:hypothetical protein
MRPLRVLRRIKVEGSFVIDNRFVVKFFGQKDSVFGGQDWKRELGHTPGEVLKVGVPWS